MTLQWTTTQQAAQQHGVKMLVYGDAGVGKTVLCATAPRPVILSAEAGLLSLRKVNLERLYGVGAQGVTSDIPVVQVTTVQQLSEALALLATPQARERFSTVCVDSLSEIAEVVLSNAKQMHKDPRKAYGDLIEKVEAFVRAVRDLPGYHVYVSAKLSYSKDDDGVTRAGPSAPGAKLGPALPYYFDEVFRLGIATDQGNKYRFLQTDGDLKYVAKDRSGALAQLEPPHLGHIISKINGETP